MTCGSCLGIRCLSAGRLCANRTVQRFDESDTAAHPSIALLEQQAPIAKAPWVDGEMLELRASARDELAEYRRLAPLVAGCGQKKRQDSARVENDRRVKCEIGAQQHLAMPSRHAVLPIEQIPCVIAEQLAVARVGKVIAQ